MKVKNLVLTILIAIFTFIPLGVFAEGETNSKVIINFFHGDGCPHCANAQDFFTSIAQEHGSKYDLVKYEVRNNEKNQKLMMAVGDYLEADVSGVPFIVIGDKVFNGYAENYDEQIIAKINEEYAKPENERINVTEMVDVVGEPGEGTIKEKEDGTFASIVFLVIILGFAGLIVFARQKNTTSKVKEVKQPKTVKIEPTKEDKKEEIENRKQNKNKKTSKNKKK